MCALESQIHVLDGGFSTQLCKHVSDPIDGTPLWSASFLHTNPNAVINTHLDFLQVSDVLKDCNAFKTLGTTHLTQLHIPEDLNLHHHRCKNLDCHSNSIIVPVHILAGADVLKTNTYQASTGGFIKYLGLSTEESYQLIKTAVNLAKSACLFHATEVGSTADTHKVLIAGSVGPYGTSLHDCSEYTGSYVEHVSPKEMVDWHRPRIRALVEAGADILGFETIPAQSEAEALVELLKEFPEQKAWLSFSCKNEVHTCHGENFQHAARRCWEINPSQLVAVGVNCVSPKYVSSLLTGINKDRPHSPVPLIVYPNSGERYDREKGWTDGDKCCPIENYVEEWLNLGVTYIGGCCRTYAADIVRIKEEVNKWQSVKNSIKSNWNV